MHFFRNNPKTPQGLAALILSLFLMTALLTGCQTSGQGGSPPLALIDNTTIPRDVPQRFYDCQALFKLPKRKPGQRGYTLAQVKAALSGVRASEIEKADCVHDLIEFYGGTVGAITGATQ